MRRALIGLADGCHLAAGAVGVNGIVTTEATFLWGGFSLRSGMSKADLIPFTRETSPIAHARARKCDWCARPSLKGAIWCPRHAPGYAGDRRSAGSNKGGASAARYVSEARDDFVAERMIPAELATWAPIVRLVAIRPRHTRPVKMFDVVRAFASRAAGDHAPWSEIVAGMRAAGIMREGDSPWHA